LFFIEKVRALEKLGLRDPKSLIWHWLQSPQAAQKLERIPLSNDTVQQSIEDKLDVEEQAFE